MLFLLYWLLTIACFLSDASKLKTRCDKSVTPSLNIPEIHVRYYRGTCYVFDKRAKKFDDVRCNHFLVNGYLALLPGHSLISKIYEFFLPYMGATINDRVHFGFKRNDSTSAGQRRDLYHWYIDDQQQWPAPEAFVKWHPGEPYEVGMLCGHLWNTGGTTYVWAYICATTIPFICEYRDRQSMIFMTKLRGVRGSANVTVSEHNTAHGAECCLLCAKLPICQSYTYSKQQQLCALHFLPAQELVTEQLSDGQVFDIVE